MADVLPQWCTLEAVDQHKDLGDTIFSNFKWASYVASQSEFFALFGSN